MKKLSIAEVIRRIQIELIESEEQRIRSGIPPIFQVENVDLTISFEIVKNINAKGSFSIAVISTEIGGEVRQSSLNSITIHLKMNQEYLGQDKMGLYPEERAE